MGYAKIAASVDAKDVTDEMIAKSVITFEKADAIKKLETRSERMFELIGKLFLGGHPKSFIVFRSALVNDYPWLVKMIDETDISNLQSESVTEEEERLNKNLKKEVQECLPTIATSIDPKGYVLDLLYQDGVLQWSEMSELMKLKEQEDRVRKLITRLGDSSHPKSFIIFVKGLGKDYVWMADKLKYAVQNC